MFEGFTVPGILIANRMAPFITVSNTPWFSENIWFVLSVVGSTDESGLVTTEAFFFIAFDLFMKYVF